MNRIFTVAMLAFVGLAAQEVQDTTIIDAKVTIEEIQKAKKEKSKKCKPCRPGYEQDESACKCNIAPLVPALCKTGHQIDNNDCKCQGADEPYESKCFYHYSRNNDCQCEQPPACDLTRRDCKKGEKFDRKNCACLAKAECEPCGSGFKQNPWTCECFDRTQSKMQCPNEGVFDQNKCTCTWTNKEGMSKSKGARCRLGYAPSSDCSKCELKPEELCKKMKCPLGQGWNQDSCACVKLPTCTVTEAMVKCKRGYKFDKMKCACVLNEGKYPGRGGKSGDKAVEDYAKIVEEMEAQLQDQTNKDPINDGTKDPITDDTTKEPINDGTKEPINDGTKEPIDGDTKEPINDGTKEPINDGTKEPINDGTKEPINDGTKEPINDGTQEPINDGTKEPINDGTKEPINDGTKEPINDGTKEPINDGTKEPINDGTKEPINDGTKEPINDGTQDPMIKEPVYDPSILECQCPPVPPECKQEPNCVPPPCDMCRIVGCSCTMIPQTCLFDMPYCLQKAEEWDCHECLMKQDLTVFDKK